MGNIVNNNLGSAGYITNNSSDIQYVQSSGQVVDGNSVPVNGYVFPIEQDGDNKVLVSDGVSGFTWEVYGGGGGATPSLAQVLGVGNETLGNNMIITTGDIIYLSPTASPGTKIWTTDQGGGQYATTIESKFDVTGYSASNTIMIDPITGFQQTSDEDPASGQKSNLYFNIGTNGYQLKHTNKTTNRNYWFYTQNEGYTPGGGGEADYGVKTWEWIGNTCKIQKSRSYTIAPTNSKVMWRSESLFEGHVCHYTIEIMGRVTTSSTSAQVSTIRFAVGWEANKTPYFIGSPNVEEYFTTTGAVDYSLSLDTTFNAGRVILTLTNSEADDIDYSVRVEELSKEPI